MRCVCCKASAAWSLERQLHCTKSQALTRRCQANLRKKHAVANIRLAYELFDAGETGIEVLLSERSSERNRYNRIRALPLNGLVRSVPIPNKVARRPKDAAEGLSVRPLRQAAEIGPKQPEQPYIDPQYLFACGILWRTQAAPDAGWELIRCLRSRGETPRMIAAWLLTQEDVEAAAGPGLRDGMS
jgi:hypothetical protein